MNTEVIEKSQIEKINKSCENYKYVYNSKFSKFSRLDDWLEKESVTFKDESERKIYSKPNFKQGEIIKVDFGINMGSELSNTHFAIVLNSDDNSSVDNITVLPLTSKPGYKRIYLGTILSSFSKYYDKKTYALITQVTTISKNKIFRNSIRCYCDKDIFKKLQNEIVNYFTK